MHEAVEERLRNAWGSDPEKELPEYPEPADPFSLEDEQEKGTYQYVLLGYRIEDAQRLGLIPSYGDEEEQERKQKETDGKVDS